MSEQIESVQEIEDLDLDLEIEKSNEESLYGVLKFALNPLSEKQIEKFEKRLDHFVSFFPEVFRNPFTGEEVKGDIAFKLTNSKNSKSVIFELKQGKEKTMFFGLRLDQRKIVRVNGLKNKGTLFIVSVLELLRTLDHELVEYGQGFTKEIVSLSRLMTGTLISNLEEDED